MTNSATTAVDIAGCGAPEQGDPIPASVDLAKVDREWVITIAELKPIPTRPLSR